MKYILLFFFSCFVAIPFFGQPTTAARIITVDFRFFEDGKLLDSSMVAENYRFLDADRKDLANNAYFGIHNYDNEGTLAFSSVVYYEDLVRKIVRSGDTMSLIFKNYRDSDKGHYSLDSLYFKPGHYLIYDTGSGRFFHTQARADHYNDILSWFKRSAGDLPKQYWENSLQYKVLQDLRKKYGIPEDDFNPKSANEIKVIDD